MMTNDVAATWAVEGGERLMLPVMARCVVAVTAQAGPVGRGDASEDDLPRGLSPLPPAAQIGFFLSPPREHGKTMPG